ncbi:hypothetical protein ACFL1G_12335 [Planctomycetota bacterium]
MFKNILIIMAILFICFGTLTGCKKKSEPSAEDVVKTAEEYKAQAEEEITAENMEAELEKLEKEINTELQQEQ